MDGSSSHEYERLRHGHGYDKDNFDDSLKQLEQPRIKRARRGYEHQEVGKSGQVRMERERQRDIAEPDEVANQLGENDSQRTKKIAQDRSSASENLTAAAPPLNPPSNQEYTVGWTCALPIEMAAAKAMLGENYGGPNEQDELDKNNFLLSSRL
jgi:hypothetical protein